MTIDDAIRHCEEVADGMTEQGKCEECAAEHKQLAEWLKEFKQLREQIKWIPITEYLPEEDGCYLVTENSGRICTYVFHKEGNSEEYWKRCAVAWMPFPEPYKLKSEVKK